jgi:protoporphyrinogen oxidase
LIGCLWINKPQVFPEQTIYYTNRVFNRLAQMNSYSRTITPEGTCGITAEMTCRQEDALWLMPEKDLLKRIIADMEKEGLLSAGDVKDGMVLRSTHGYPIYQLGFEEHLRRLRQAVQAIPNLYVAGRQGLFNYAQMHFGVNAGMLLAKHLNQGSPKPPITTSNLEEAYFS